MPCLLAVVMRKILTYWVFFFLGNALNAIHGKQMPHRSSFTQVRLCQNRLLKSTHGAHRQHKSVLFGFIEQLNKRWRYHDVMRRFTRELIFRTRYHPSEDYIMFEPILNKSIFLFGILSLHVLTTFYPIPWHPTNDAIIKSTCSSTRCKFEMSNRCFQAICCKRKIKNFRIENVFLSGILHYIFFSFHFVYLSRRTWSW